LGPCRIRVSPPTVSASPCRPKYSASQSLGRSGPGPGRASVARMRRSGALYGSSHPRHLTGARTSARFIGPGPGPGNGPGRHTLPRSWSATARPTVEPCRQSSHASAYIRGQRETRMRRWSPAGEWTHGPGEWTPAHRVSGWDVSPRLRHQHARLCRNARVTQCTTTRAPGRHQHSRCVFNAPTVQNCRPCRPAALALRCTLPHKRDEQSGPRGPVHGPRRTKRAALPDARSDTGMGHHVARGLKVLYRSTV
jgi:hypothetical protein